MKKNFLVKTIAVVAAMAMMTVGLAGCGEKSNNENANENQSEQLSGNLSLAGSTSMEKLANALAEAFMEKNQDVRVNAEFTGSSAGIESLIAGRTNIGNASRSLSDEEQQKGAVENVVAIDGIAVILDKDNKVKDLTKDQLVSIYKGEVKNWKEVGGSDQAIVVVGREAGSGTRGAFEELLEVEDLCAYSNELESTGAVLAKVAATKGAIGYVSLDVVDQTVQSVKVNGVEATEENILDGKYILNRPFVMATMGELEKQSDLIKAWFSFIDSEEGQEVIKAVGLIVNQK
ncbi:MAG: phosphate ABC transporter substrate-binding protein [Lachnospiraceae bacterium]|nr:phosphate ABC transporter substrate-binding protein [Lachnospiraceae bacterium]